MNAQNWIRIGFKRNGENPKYLEPCIIYKGYPCRILAVGYGEKHWVSDGIEDAWEEYENYKYVFTPFFCSVTMPIDLQKKTKGSNISLEECLELGYEKYLIQLGDFESYSCWNETERKQHEFLEKKEVVFWQHSCWETGLMWYQLALLFGARYPENVFNVMKPFLKYHSEQEEEEGDWKGWATTNLKPIQEGLEKIGWTIKNYE